MKLHKWLALFAGMCVVTAALFALFNVAVDPFGVFGDRLMNWYAYDMTQNPRVAKLAYLEEHHDDYNSYVIGSSKVSSISCEKLNNYMDASFYNLTWYGGKLGDEVSAASYILENYEVKNMVLLLEPQNAQDFITTTTDLKERMYYKADGSSTLHFYFSYLFANPNYAIDKIDAWIDQGYLVEPAAVYIPETGVYNKQRRDVEPIGSLDEYLANNTAEFAALPTVTSMPFIEQCVESVRQLKQRCEEKDVNLIVLMAPQYEGEFLSFSQEHISQLWRGLAEVVDFWDFSGLNSIGQDPRYFYDSKHFRNCVGDMALARIFGDGSVYVPEDFGTLVTSENVEERLTELWTPADSVQNAQIPILMYHSLTENPDEVSSMTMTVDTFRSHMEALYQAGYTAITYEDMNRFVLDGAPLPDKPVIITFDDGYANNLTLGAPVLQSYGYCAEIAVIGCSAGKDTYKDTDTPMIPHFSMEEAQPWIDAGVIALNAHSYDMHQVAELDGENCRSGVLPLPDESEQEYIAALEQDYAALSAVIDPVMPDDAVRAFTYPYGKYNEISEVVLDTMGVTVTVTTEPGMAEVVRGLPQSMRVLNRFAMTEEVTPQELLGLVQSNRNN